MGCEVLERDWTELKTTSKDREDVKRIKEVPPTLQVSNDSDVNSYLWKSMWNRS
jgi:hypothetical protein